MFACLALEKLEKLAQRKVTSRLTHYLHSVTLTSIVHILQSEQNCYFSLGLVLWCGFIFHFIIIGFKVICCEINGSFCMVTCAVFLECVALPI